MCLLVDMGDPQAFAAGIPVRQAAGEEFAGGREAVELQREFGTLIPHAATYSETAPPDAIRTASGNRRPNRIRTIRVLDAAGGRG